MLRGRPDKFIIQGILLVSILFTASGITNAQTTCPDNAQQFWKKFRHAVLQSDSPILTNMVQFPLEVRGTLDDSKASQINKDAFSKILPELLSTDPGLSAEPTTMNNYIQSVESLPASSCNMHGNQFRVGSWVFSEQNNRWLFTQAFIEV